jgi:hypothetical protein
MLLHNLILDAKQYPLSEAQKQDLNNPFGISGGFFLGARG